MAAMSLITVGQMKELLKKYNDDIGLDFGDFEFQGLSLNNENMVDVELKLIIDHESGFKENEKSLSPD